MCLCCKWEKQIPLLLLRVTNASWRRANFSKSQAFAFLAIGAGVENKEFAIPQTSCTNHTKLTHISSQKEAICCEVRKSLKIRGLNLAVGGTFYFIGVFQQQTNSEVQGDIFSWGHKVIRSFINGKNSYMSAIGWFEIKNIAKGTTDPRVEFGLPK